MNCVTQPAHDLLVDLVAAFGAAPFHAHTVRGEYMITITPTRQISAPTTS